MRQLVELRKNSDQFEEYGVEIICVFREEAKGVEGLKLVKDKTKVDFTLALDRDKEKTRKYSPGRRKFDNYVIDKNGVICAIIDGSLRKRALAKQLLAALEEIESGKSQKKSDSAKKEPGKESDKNESNQDKKAA
jgi:peroxiredoxin